MAIGLSLGADVPFFLFGRNAFVEGVGEQLTAVVTPERHFALIYPGRALSTALIFGAPELTRNTDPIKMSDFCADAGSGGIPTLADDFGRNDLEPVAAARLPEVAAALEWLGRRGNARMSGSGACVFCAFASQQAALESLLGLPSQWTGWTCSSLPRHPLADWANE
jgi:4-diphosphocytidyl-2-C-methyl-D-erythritol kinase